MKKQTKTNIQLILGATLTVFGMSISDIKGATILKVVGIKY